jgi:hypothetical protein
MTASGNPEAKRPKIYEWEGALVLIGYTAGPEVTDLDDMFSVVRAPVEAKFGLYILSEVSSLGVMIEKVISDDEDPEKVGFATPIFAPWGTVQSIELVSEFEENQNS